MYVSMKYNGKSILDPLRHTHRGDSMLRNFRQDLVQINNDMRNLRWKNLRVMDSNTDAELLWAQFIQYIDVKLNKAAKLFPDVEIYTGITYDEDNRNYDDGFPSISFNTQVHFTKDNTIKCYSDNGTNLLDEIKMYPFTLHNKTNLFMAFNGWSTHFEKTEDERYKLIEAARRRLSRYNQWSKGWRAKYHPKYINLRHPFIGSPITDIEQVMQGNDYTNVCFGDNVSDVNITHDMLDFPSLIHIMDEWSSIFIIGRTNPLQQMNLWRFGVPKDSSIEQATTVGLDPRWCYDNQALNGNNINFLIACDDCQLNPNNADEDTTVCESYVAHQKVSSKDILNEAYIEEIANTLCNWILTLFTKDRMLRGLEYSDSDKIVMHDKIVILKSRIISMLIHPSLSNFKDIIMRGLSVRVHNYSHDTGIHTLSENSRDQIRRFENHIHSCKNEWGSEHHNGYDRLLNEIELWQKTFSKVLSNDNKPSSRENNKEEAWIAMLKRTGQDITTPIGR